MKVTIREAALQRGKSLYRLAMDLSIPHQTVYGWQNYNRLPAAEYLDEICNYLDCSVNEILKPENPTMLFKRY